MLSNTKISNWWYFNDYQNVLNMIWWYFVDKYEIIILHLMIPWRVYGKIIRQSAMVSYPHNNSPSLGLQEGLLLVSTLYQSIL